MIIGIAGEAGSGKGTAAEVLLQKGYERGKFSGALKDMLRAFLRYRRVDEVTIERMIEGDLKEVPAKEFGGKTPRYAMQTLGTGWGRKYIDPNLWVDTEMEVTADKTDVVFDDVRHDEEEDAILARGGVIVQIVGRRKGIKDKHESESFQPKNPVQLDNSGTIPELKTKVETVVRDLSWALAA